MAARCDSESANALGVKMAHEIVAGKRTVEEPGKTSVKSTVAYNMSRGDAKGA